jgi:hypothetical protein
LKQAGRHAAAKKIVEDRGSEATFVGEGNGRDTDTEMNLLEVALGFEIDGRGSERHGFGVEVARRLEVAKFLLRKIEHLLRRKPILKTAKKGFAAEIADGFGSAKYGAAEGMFRPEAASENVVEEIFGIVQIHLDFFEDDLALFVDVAGVELGTKNEIGDDVKGDGEMLVEDLSVEADLFLGGEGIEHAADGIHFAGDVFGGTAFSTLENHVLEEMSKAIFGGGFAAGTISDPDADRDGADVLHGLSDDNESVWEDVAMNVARSRSHKTLWHRVGQEARVR